MGCPSPAWIAWSDTVMQAAGVEHAVVLTLELGQHWIRQRGWRGTKVVELGTGHEAGLPWLTALDGPVMVLQPTGRPWPPSKSGRTEPGEGRRDVAPGKVGPGQEPTLDGEWAEPSGGQSLQRRDATA